MIRLPWTNGAASYTQLDNKEDLIQFIKRKRTMKMVIFTNYGDLLPTTCAKCGKPINKDDGNRVDIYPKQKLVLPYHYECAWKVILSAIYKLSDDIRSKGIQL